mgnify:CR=1 FL=1
MRVILFSLLFVSISAKANFGGIVRSLGDVANRSAANAAKGGNLKDSVGAALAQKSGQDGGVLGTLEGLGASGLDADMARRRGGWGTAGCCPCQANTSY